MYSGTLDIPPNRQYLSTMNIVRRTFEIDADTDARLQEMARERGQDVATLLAEAVALLDSVLDIEAPDLAEDRRRLEQFRQTREAVSMHDVKAWIESWGTESELPSPRPQRFE